MENPGNPSLSKATQEGITNTPQEAREDNRTSIPREKPLVQIVCTVCSSTDVMRDAWAVWDAQLQEWTLSNVFDAGYCSECDGGRSLTEIPYVPEAGTPSPDPLIRMLQYALEAETGASFVTRKASLTRHDVRQIIERLSRTEIRQVEHRKLMVVQPDTGDFFALDDAVIVDVPEAMLTDEGCDAWYERSTLIGERAVRANVAVVLDADLPLDDAD